AIAAPPGGVTLDRDKRVALLPRRPHGRDEEIEAVAGRDGPKPTEDRLFDATAAVFGKEARNDGAERRWRALDTVGQRPVEATRRRSVVFPGHRHAACVPDRPARLLL